MAAQTIQLTLELDSEQLQQDMALLADAAERFPKVRELLLELGSKPGGIDVQLVPTGGARSFRYRAEFCNGAASLVAAVRAGDFDAQ